MDFSEAFPRCDGSDLNSAPQVKLKSFSELGLSAEVPAPASASISRLSEDSAEIKRRKWEQRKEGGGGKSKMER